MAMVEVARFQDPISADFAKARLDAAGIHAVLLGHHTAGLFGGALMPSRLMVLPEDEVETRQLLSESLPKK